MRVRAPLITLGIVVALLAAFAAGAGLLLSDSSAPAGSSASTAFTTLRGQTAILSGEGLYRYDTVFFAAGFRGQDTAVLLLGIPLLIGASWWYRGGSVGAQLFLTSMLGYFLYLYASMALGAAYNPLFLLYVATFSASLFGFVLSFTAVDRQQLARRAPFLPHRALVIFMVLGGAITLVVWGMPLVAALLADTPPARLDSYTTMVTYALDLAIITPGCFVCAYLVARRQSLGYVVAAPLLLLIALLAPQIMLSTYFQYAAGVPFSPSEMVGPVAGFTVLGLIAIWLLVSLLRRSGVRVASTA